MSGGGAKKASGRDGRSDVATSGGLFRGPRRLGETEIEQLAVGQGYRGDGSTPLTDVPYCRLDAIARDPSGPCLFAEDVLIGHLVTFDAQQLGCAKRRGWAKPDAQRSDARCVFGAQGEGEASLPAKAGVRVSVELRICEIHPDEPASCLSQSR